MAKLHNKIIRGFTLIELMVVISIIGMLSSVMMVSLKNARNKSLDAKVKAQLRNLRSSAAIYRDTIGNGTYGAIVNASTWGGNDTIGYGCAQGMFIHQSILPYLSKVNNPSFVVDDSYTRCVAINQAGIGNADKYMVILKLSNGDFYCVDSVGTTVEKPVNYRLGLSTRTAALLIDGNGQVPLYLMQSCIDLWC